MFVQVEDEFWRLVNGAERAAEKCEESIDFDVTLSAVATAGVESSGRSAVQCSGP